MSYIGGPLPGKEKEEVDLNEKKLVGSRVTEIIGKGINALPKDNTVLNTIGSGLGYIAENYTHKDLIKAEEAIIDKVGEIAPSIGFDPTFLQLSAGFLIPGAGEMKTIKKTIKSAHLLSDAVQSKVKSKQLYNTKLLRPDYIPEGDWKKLVIKFTEDASDVAEESARWGSELIKEAHDYFKVKGSLKDFGSIRIDKNTGKIWLIKNKRGKLDTQKMGPRFGIDSLEKTTAGRIIREATAKVNEKDVWKWAREIQEKNSDITDGMIKEYIKAQKAHKRDLQKLIKNLNYDEGKGTWSLGHREAVASFTKRGEVGADIIQNLELEPFRDMFNPKTGEWIRGNASRSAGAELERILLRASNQSTNIGEDILKFLDPDIGNFWPRMGEITNKAQWLKQTGLREQYYDNIRALAKKEGISLQEAADEYLLDIMSKTKRSQAPLFN